MLFTLCIFTLFFTQISLTKVPDEITSEVPAISESSSYETTVKPQASSRKSNSDTKNATNSNSTDVTLVSATNSTSKRSKNNRTQKSLTTVPDESTSEVPEISASSSYETNITSVKPQASSRKSNSDTKNATNLNSTDVTLVPAINVTKKRPKNKTKATTERSTDAFSTPEQNSSDEQRNKSETKTTKFTTSTESSTFNSADSSFETESVTTDVNNDENYGSTSDGAANSPESDTNFSNETLEDDESMSENSSIEFSTVITSSLDDFTEDSVGVTNQTVSYSTPTTLKPPPVTKSTDHTTEPTDTGLIGKNPPDMISSSSPSLTATKATGNNESKSNSASGTALTATFGVLVFIVATFVVVLKSKRRCMTYFSKRMGTRASRSLSLNNLTTASSPKLPVHNQPVGISDFEKHFNKMSADSKLLFSVEFDNLNSSSPVYPCSAALMSENQGKNRWTNILPFDHSRVKLLPIADDLSSDYINANYIPGVNSQREYIATQGPLPHTVDDFWRMVWEQSSSMIVMLTQCIERGKVKCEQYWPNDTETQYYGDLAISLKSESILPEYTIRIFDLQLGSRVMEVKQTHFTMWPDFGCPESTQLLIDFVSNVRGYIPRNSTGPIIVHCSAGVGRTGTYIAVERLLYDAVKQEAIDVYRVVREMRRYRNFMVQTEDQYVYIHECLRDFLRKLRDSCTELSTTESQMFLNKMESSL